jgi:hypothetical protein
MSFPAAKKSELGFGGEFETRPYWVDLQNFREIASLRQAQGRLLRSQ